MNWDAVDFDWNQARAFLATAEEGSLSAAARALDMTQPTLSRQVGALEEKLGVTLFERGPRTMRLTAAGLEVREHVRAMFEAATRASLAASGQSQSICGMVRIASTHTMACYHLPDIMRELRTVAPELEIELRTSNDLRDLIHREADIAIRHARPKEPELIAKRVRTTHADLFASRAYLDRVGRPQNVEDVRKLEFLGFETAETLLPAYKAQGLDLTRSNFPITADSGTVSLELARFGLGVALLLPDDTRQFPELERVWPDFTPIDVPVWLVTHRELHTSKRIRLVFDLLAKRIGDMHPT